MSLIVFRLLGFFTLPFVQFINFSTTNEMDEIFDKWFWPKFLKIKKISTSFKMILINVNMYEMSRGIV